MTRLGVALLLISATLFAFDVGGTFALDRGSEKAGAAIAPVLEQPVATRVAAPLAVLQGAAPSTMAQHIASTPPSMIGSGKPVRVASPVNAGAPVHIATPIHVATPVHVASPVHVAKRTIVAAPRRRIAARPPVAKRIAVAIQTRNVFIAVATQPRRVAIVIKPVAPKAPTVRRVRVRPAQQNVATLRDVRKYVMHVLASRYRGFSVISAATYAGDGGVVVNMVVHDRRREWFERDVVHRAGSELSILSERQRTMPGTVRRLNHDLPRSKMT